MKNGERDVQERAFRVLRSMRELRAFERQHLPFLGTLADHDLVLEIGCRQCEQRPLKLKELLLSGLGSVPTVQRRLSRLRRLGVVQQQRCQDDRRAFELGLTPGLMATLAQYGEDMDTSGRSGDL